MSRPIPSFVKQLNKADPERTWYVDRQADDASDGVLIVESDGLHTTVGYVHWDASHVYWHPSAHIPYVDVIPELRPYECPTPEDGF